MTVLDQKIIFSLYAAASVELQEQIRGIPGVFFTKRGQILSPINAAEIVRDFLLSQGIAHSMSKPRFGLEDAQHKLRNAYLSGEIREHVDGIPFLTHWLKPFQQMAITFLLQRSSGLIWSSAGSGKTALAVVSALCHPGNVVVVTKGGARFQWASEVRRFTTIDPYVWKPESTRRKKDLTPAQYAEKMREQGKRAFIICGWEMLVDLQEEVKQLFSPSIVVFDEIHRGKQGRRKKWFEDENGELTSRDLGNMSSAAYTLAKFCKVRIGTTATPIMNRLSDFWGQLTLIEPDSWGGTASKFLERYCGARPGEYGGLVADGMSNLDELRTRIGYAVHQIPYQVSHGQLPEKRRRVSLVPVDQQVKPIGSYAKEVKGLAKAMHQAQSEGSSVARAILDRMTEIRIMEACSRKRKAIVDRVMEVIEGDQPKRKVVVFSGRREDVEAIGHELEKLLEKRAIACPVLIGHGEIDAEDREALRVRYMAENVAILVGTYQSFGESLNLHDTDYCCVAMIPYRPGEVEQLEGRVHRLGMNRSVLIEFLIAERSADERVKYLLLDKLPAVDKLSDGQSALAGLTGALEEREKRDERMADLVAAISSWSMDDVELDE